MEQVDVILGASGYIGRNLVNAAGARSFFEISARQIRGRGAVLDFADACFDFKGHAISRLDVRDIFLLSRPPTSDFGVNRRFHDGLQSTLLGWCARKTPRCIHFASTTLLYAGTDEERVRTRGLPSPYGTYEYFKLETELFLRHLQLALHPAVEVVIYRLPVAFGGLYDPVRNANQFIYSYISSYRNGKRWKFATKAENEYGSSWFQVEELCSKLLNHMPQTGSFRTVDVSSGFCTFRRLHDFLESWLGPQISGELALPRSRAFVQDQLGMSPREITDEIRNLPALP